MAFIRPTAPPAVIEGSALEDAFQETIVGVTGMDPKLVRPSWQPVPPNLPDFSLNWAAFRIGVTDSDVFAFVRQVNDTDLELEHDQRVNVLASFYGPGAEAFTSMLRDGLQIEQNRFALGALGVKLVSTGTQRHLPSLVKEMWQQRYDLPLIFNRRIRRVYKSDSINSATLGLDNEFYITPITVSPPTP